jgi:hypothetical protein
MPVTQFTCSNWPFVISFAPLEAYIALLIGWQVVFAMADIKQLFFFHFEISCALPSSPSRVLSIPSLPTFIFRTPLHAGPGTGCKETKAKPL